MLKEIDVILLFHYYMPLTVILIQLQSNLPKDVLFESEHLVFKTKDLKNSLMYFTVSMLSPLQKVPGPLFEKKLHFDDI